ncbi:hypothetical protein ABEB36_005253 [Hypothenemus hampei]|uniref:Ectopic P granules protein 5 homolog n=1 Tax=Hypothenemus hampei TaxID=57062 RepID=A0ABD1EXJ9_HYPHA
MEAVAEKPKKKTKNKSNPSESSAKQNKVLASEKSGNECNNQPEIAEDCVAILSINHVDNNPDIEEIAESSITYEREPIENNIVQSEQQINETIVQPSAPQSDNFEKFLNMNKQILNTLEIIDSIPAQIANVPLMAEPQQLNEEYTIRPYTEQQLKALYYNSELDLIEDFTKNFIETELKCSHSKKHYLFELLNNYLKTREKIAGNNIELQQLRNEYHAVQTELWSSNVSTVGGSALCLDGKIVSATHEYNRSIFHRSVFQNISHILDKVQKLTYEQHILFSYLAEDLRMQIGLHIEEISTCIINLRNLNDKSPIVLLMKEDPNEVQPYINKIRASISVLFAFQRKHIKDQKFLDDTRTWLAQLVAVLLRIGTYQDHLFLLLHILRSPAGVSTWASTFIQVPLEVQPNEPFANYQINHLLTLLSIVLSPVTDRREFLKDMIHCQNVSSDAGWIVVDSDGEEDEETGISLKENDLVAILNQLPLGDMFRCILLISRSDNTDKYDPSLLNEQHILRFFAFSSVLLKLLRQGLQGYCLPKYNQFSKRLSRFIRHIVQYATDQWEICLKNRNVVDIAMIQRLQIEYDAFFLRAIYYLYTSQKLCTWQFLAVVPYNVVTIKTLWKIYYFLHVPDERATDILDFSLKDDYKSLLWEKAQRDQFEEKLSNLKDAEVYYLLNTFANMALARTDSEISFIYSCTMDILQVGFILPTTQETCSKSAKILLTHLCSKFPTLLSSILKEVQENLDKMGDYSLFLYEEIPLSIWKLSDNDFIIIGRLLLNNPATTVQTKLAKMILSRLNWDLLPYEKHCDTAVLVLKAVNQDAAHAQWGWQTILRLKLHISDGHFKELGRVEDLEKCETLLKGIRDGNPLASFVSILMTSWGHLVPLICSNGLNQLIFLQTHQKHEAVLFALYQIVPIFIKCQECLINSHKFQEVLMGLINADRGYISYAKSFILTKNTVLQQFGNMIETQIVNYMFYDLQSPKLLVRLWMNALVSIPNWNKDNAILYLLDVITRAAYGFPDALQVVYENFRDLNVANTPPESSFLSKLWSSSNKSGYSLLSNSLASYPWLAYIYLEVEHQEKEVRNGLWPEILKALAEQKGKISVDNAIKTATANFKLPSFSSNFLCIYRYAQQAMDTDLDHPIVPLFWQKFFILFLTRLSERTSVCVGERFFDGIVNFGFLKKIKRKLQDALEFYKNKIETSEEDNVEESSKELFRQRFSIFNAFLLWLEEPRLQSGNLLLQSLPTQYEPKLLALIINENNYAPWYQYMDRHKILHEQTMSIKQWRVANFREKTNVNQPLLNPGRGVESADPIERILRRLSSYDSTKSPPTIKSRRIFISPIDMSNSQEMFKSLKPCFATLNQFARNHASSVSELKALDENFKELVPQLFSSVAKRIQKSVPCKGKNQTILCSGPGVVSLEFQESKRNERIDHEIQINRQTYESILEKSLQSPAIALCTASVSIQQCIRLLQKHLQSNPETTELGIELFYHILSLLQGNILEFLPAKTLFASCIEKLGQTHIIGVENEMPRLLELVFKKPNLGGYIAPYFSPKNCGSANMLFMYSKITKEMSSKYEIVFALLSKFEIDNWLYVKKPNLSQRSQFIENIIIALSTLGYDPPLECLMLHGLYRKHLVTVFEFQFPEHYGEILIRLLKASNSETEDNLISESVWIDILNSMASSCKISSKLPLRDQLRQYCQHQKKLAHQELLETSNLLARHFTQERLSLNNGLHGLYPKCRKYVNVFSILLGMTGHAFIVSMLNTHQGLLGDKLSEQIWPYLRDMFIPWLAPYSVNNLKENRASSWVQQSTDDRAVLLPWLSSDGELAEKMLKSFCECIQFVLDTLPASPSILSYLFQWYVSYFGHPSVKEFVLIPVHKALITLPWTKFWPSLVDLEFMLRVVDQYLPDCHSFVGSIFISIWWTNWIKSFSDAPIQVKNRVYYCFLSLLVKLSIEPNIQRNHSEKARSILIQVENLNWNYLEPASFQHIMDWVVMSCNSAVIFKSNVLDLDYILLRLLKVISGYNQEWTQITSELIAKRQIYVKAHIKLLSVYVSRQKNWNTNEISLVVNDYLNDLDTKVNTIAETEILIKEIFSILNITPISQLALEIIVKWIENKTYEQYIKALLKTLGMTTVTNYKHLGTLYETTLTSYFNRNVLENNVEETSWKNLIESTNISPKNPMDFEQSLLEIGAVLTLNTILLQRILRDVNTETLLNHSIGWLTKLKLNCTLEDKVPLLWYAIIKLALQQCNTNELIAATQLQKFSHVLLQIAEDSNSTKWGRALLSAIGLTKSDSISLNFKFICRAMAGYVLAQLPEVKVLPRSVRFVSKAPNAIGTPGGNPECSKILLEMDFGQSQGKIKECAGMVLAKIQDPANSLHNANGFLTMLLNQFYSKPYLKYTD